MSVCLVYSLQLIENSSFIDLQEVSNDPGHIVMPGGADTHTHTHYGYAPVEVVYMQNK